MLFIYFLFEKLHRYCFDYCFQSTNEAWGKYTPYKQANRNNRLRVLNIKIVEFYLFLSPYFYKWRYKLVLYLPKRYRRYEPRTFHLLLQYELDKYYNWFDKIIVKWRVYIYHKNRFKS